MPPITRLLLTAAALAIGLPLAAQPAAAPPTAAAVPYRSAFEGYRAFRPVEVQNWRQSNDTVREVGGWRAYAREIQGATQDGAGPKPGAPANPHQGHHR